MTPNSREHSMNAYQRHLPSLFLVWIALSVISPHPDLHKAWFHLTLAIPVLILMGTARLRLDTTDTCLRVCAAFLVYTTVSSLIVSQADWGQHLHALRWSLETLSLVLVLFLALPPLIRRPLFLGRFLLTCVVLGGGAALVIFGVIHNFSGRLYGIGALYQPIEGVSVLIIYLCIGALLLWYQRYSLNWKDLTLLFAALVTTCACTLLSGSRGPTLALALAFGYCLLVSAIVHHHWKLLLLAAAAMVIALVGVFWLYGVNEFFQIMVERGTSYRLLLWRSHLEYPPESLLFGHGMATELESTAAGTKVYIEAGLRTAQPHNLFMGTFVQTGLIGLGILLALFGTVLAGIYKAKTSHKTKLYMLGILGTVIMLVATNTYTLIISVKTMWFYTWFPLVFLWLWGRSFSDASHSITPKPEKLRESPEDTCRLQERSSDGG